MGWNSWNTFGENINEEVVMQTADYIADSGLKDCGYEYVIIDDCWSLRERNEKGEIVPDPAKFPHGMKYVADYVHLRACPSRRQEPSVLRESDRQTHPSERPGQQMRKRPKSQSQKSIQTFSFSCFKR